MNQQQYQPGVAGRKRPAMQKNYHMLTNNAVLPSDEPLEVIHYHSKVLKNKSDKLAPTIRQNGQTQDTAQIYQGELRRPVNDSPPMSPQLPRENSPQGQFVSEYQSRIAGAKPDYQLKKATGKKAIAPVYQRQTEEKLYGVGLQVMAADNRSNNLYSAFNKQTLSRYNGRKRQFNDFNYAKQSNQLVQEKARALNNYQSQNNAVKNKGQNFHYLESHDRAGTQKVRGAKTLRNSVDTALDEKVIQQFPPTMPSSTKYGSSNPAMQVIDQAKDSQYKSQEDISRTNQARLGYHAKTDVRAQGPLIQMDNQMPYSSTLEKIGRNQNLGLHQSSPKTMQQKAPEGVQGMMKQVASPQINKAQPMGIGGRQNSMAGIFQNQNDKEQDFFQIKLKERFARQNQVESVLKNSKNQQDSRDEAYFLPQPSRGGYVSTLAKYPNPSGEVQKTSILGNASIQSSDRLRNGGEHMLRRNPTASDIYGLEKSATQDPNLMQMRYYQNQMRNNGAAGVPRGGGNMMKSLSQPDIYGGSQVYRSHNQENSKASLVQVRHPTSEIVEIGLNPNLTPQKRPSTKLPQLLPHQLNSFDNNQFQTVVIGQ